MSLGGVDDQSEYVIDKLLKVTERSVETTIRVKTSLDALKEEYQNKQKSNDALLAGLVAAAERVEESTAELHSWLLDNQSPDKIGWNDHTHQVASILSSMKKLEDRDANITRYIIAASFFTFALSTLVGYLIK